MMQDTVRVDEVEALVRELQSFGVGHAKLTRQAFQLEPSARKRDGRLRQLDARVESARAREACPVGAEPAADFQHAQALRLIKPRGFGDVPLRPVAMFFDRFEESARAHLRVGELRPARVLLPERTHPLLQPLPRAHTLLHSRHEILSRHLDTNPAHTTRHTAHFPPSPRNSGNYHATPATDKRPPLPQSPNLKPALLFFFCHAGRMVRV